MRPAERRNISIAQNTSLSVREPPIALRSTAEDERIGLETANPRRTSLSSIFYDFRHASMLKQNHRAHKSLVDLRWTCILGMANRGIDSQSWRVSIHFFRQIARERSVLWLCLLSTIRIA